MLFCENHDLVWEIISVSEKRTKNCIVKIINNAFEKNNVSGLFPLTSNTIFKNVKCQNMTSYRLDLKFECYFE